ncbi:hypothetical protein [Maricaulis sp.]|uniref:hypothetical protein n=1 Tax=Maricaulis sp. TaxID=1486257 RepID=UPI003513F57F
MRFIDIVFLAGSVAIFFVSSFVMVKVMGYKFNSDGDSLSKEIIKGSFKFSVCVALAGVVLVSGLFSFLGIYYLISN